VKPQKHAGMEVAIKNPSVLDGGGVQMIGALGPVPDLASAHLLPNFYLFFLP